MNAFGKRFMLIVVLAATLSLAVVGSAQAIWCEILRLPDMSCVFCHRWTKIGAETCDLWEGWCSDGWYDNGWYCWGQL